MFCVLDPSNAKEIERLALKMSWKDLDLVAQDHGAVTVVMKRLKERPHANAIVPFEYVFLSHTSEHSTTSRRARCAPPSAWSEVFWTTSSVLWVKRRTEKYVSLPDIVYLDLMKEQHRSEPECLSFNGREDT